jgi:hypothetical protein
MKTEEGIGILRTYEFAMQLANVAPDVVKSKLNVSRAIERIAEVNGAPPDVFFSEEEAQAQQEQQSAGAAMAAMVDAGPDIAQATKAFAQAQDIARRRPPIPNQPGA